MPDDKQQTVDWQNDPDFHALPLAEKHKVLLQVDPDYKGLPAKEQAKALDTIHYGTLGQISGEGISTKGIGTGIANTLKGMMPPPPEGPVLSKKFWLGNDTVSIDPSKGGLAQAGREMSNEYQRSTQAGSNPLAAAGSAGVVGAGSLLGASNEQQQKLAEQGEGGQIIGQSAVPVALSAVMPMVGKALGSLPGRGVPVPTEAGSGLSSNVTGTIGRTIGHATHIPGAGAFGEFIGKKFGRGETPAAPVEAGESPASILAERGKRMAAHAEMEEFFADRQKQQVKDLAKRRADIENARQKEITDWAKLDKVSEADHAAFQDRISQLESERQSTLADEERLRNQHAQSIVQRGAAQKAMDAANAQKLTELEKSRQGELAGQERLKEQHAAALNARKAPKAPAAPPSNPFAGMTSTAPAEVPQGSPTPFQRPGGLSLPPTPTEPVASITEQPTIGSQIAAKNKSSILSRGRTLYQLGEEPDLSNPTHAKIINDLQTRSGPALRTMAKNGDRFAAFVLRTMPRP